MNVSDRQHSENLKSLKLLESQGFKFEIDADRYMVRLNGNFVGGAGVKTPRERKLHWRHRAANVRDNLESAVILAKRNIAALPGPGEPRSTTSIAAD